MTPSTPFIPIDDDTVRVAAPDDRARLVALCRRAFPGSLRWRAAGRAAEDWWDAVLGADGVETWVSTAGTELRGFLVLVTDERDWSRVRPPSETTRVIAALRRPRTALACLLARRAERGSSAPDRLPARSGAPVGRRTWIELVAVDPAHRGSGVAAGLLRTASSRTEQLGRSHVQLAVARTNDAALRCYARSGFAIDREADDQLVLACAVPLEETAG